MTPTSGSSSASASARKNLESPSVLEASSLRKTFGETVAVGGLSLHLGSHELYGLVGPDGAGKTTTVRMLTGLTTPDRGEALVLGRPSHKGQAEVREAIGYMPQLYSLYGDLSVDENLRFFGQLFGLRRKVFQKRRGRLLSITRLARFGSRRADALSGGMYKKLALACALLHKPRILLLDEPTNGVDPVSRRELWDLLYEFVDEGMAVLVTTPYMDEAEKCHRVGLIHEGKILEEGPPMKLVESFQHEVYLLSGPHGLELEEAIHRRREVLAVTPRGASLKVEIRGGFTERFSNWLKDEAPQMSLSTTSPDFEDVFLGLMAQSQGPKKNGKGEKKEKTKDHQGVKQETPS